MAPFNQVPEARSSVQVPSGRSPHILWHPQVSEPGHGGRTGQTISRGFFSLLRISFPTLGSAAALCGGQADHVAAIKSYVGDVCDRPSAFRGVLNLFEGSYNAGVNAALSGLQNSVQIGDKMRTELLATRDDFVEADLAAYKLMRDALGDLGVITPYQLPTGNDDYHRGGPPPSASPGKDDDLDGLDGNDYVDGAREHGLRDTQRETDQPKWAKSLEDRYQDWWDQHTDKDADERRVDDDARDRQRDDARDAGERARDAAKADGASRAEARDEGKETRRHTNQDHRDFNDGRNLGGRTGAHANDLYNEANDLTDNINDLGEHVHNIAENNEQAEDLDEFRDRDEDRDLQDWGKR